MVMSPRKDTRLKLLWNRTLRKKCNLKLLSSECHKISARIAHYRSPMGIKRKQIRPIHSRNLHENGENFRRCQSMKHPCLLSHGSDIFHSFLVIQYFSLVPQFFSLTEIIAIHVAVCKDEHNSIIQTINRLFFYLDSRQKWLWIRIIIRSIKEYKANESRHSCTCIIKNNISINH